MYDELISSLRICGRINSADDNCIAFRDGSCEAEPVCMYELMDKAADAIEDLQKLNRELLFRVGQAEALIDYYQTGRMISNEPPKGDE